MGSDYIHPQTSSSCVPHSHSRTRYFDLNCTAPGLLSNCSISRFNRGQGARANNCKRDTTQMQSDSNTVHEVSELILTDYSGLATVQCGTTRSCTVVLRPQLYVANFPHPVQNNLPVILLLMSAEHNLSPRNWSIQTLAF